MMRRLSMLAALAVAGCGPAYHDVHIRAMVSAVGAGAEDLTLSVGSSHGVSLNQVFRVYRGVGTLEYVTKVNVYEVRPTYSRAKVLPDWARGEANVGDLAEYKGADKNHPRGRTRPTANAPPPPAE